MPVSANTLFHFTKNIDNLIGILQNEFKPYYCEEKSLWCLSEDHAMFDVVWAVPMVCFCDLPLSMVRNHMDDYGEYALGMSKRWGIKKGLNPVIYVCNGSDLAKALFNSNKFEKSERSMNFEAYIKPYEQTRDDIKKQKYKRFYDEREWRYVPTQRDDDMLAIGPDIYYYERKLADANKRIGDKYRLSFGPNDIKYIVIHSEEERLRIIDTIEDVKGRYPSRIVKKLTSRILSSRQIKDDF